MEITEKDFPRLHKELWVWCSKNPEKQKHDWQEWEKGYLPHIKNYCFACEYAKNHNGFCPLLGGICEVNNLRGVDCLDGLYTDWCCADKNYKKRSKIALVIANLPWMEK